MVLEVVLEVLEVILVVLEVVLVVLEVVLEVLEEILEVLKRGFPLRRDIKAPTCCVKHDFRLANPFSGPLKGAYSTPRTEARITGSP